MASIVNSVINNYLSEFLEIDPDKTVANLFAGTVELENIKFKKTLFNAINVPFLELEDGYIGKIKVELSLPRFYLYPINVFINKIYVRIKPKNVNKITKEDILKIYDDFKNKTLLKFEEVIKLKLKESENKTDETEGDSDDENFIQKAINNLHINISKIILIFDDCLSDTNHPYFFGITLNEIFIESTSKDFTEIQEEDKSSPFKYKKLSINNLNIFLDRQIAPEKKDTVYDALSLKYKKNKYMKDIEEVCVEEKKFLGESIFFYSYCETEFNDLCKKSDSHNYILRELIFELKLIINTKYPVISDKPQFDVQMEMKNINTQISTNQIKSSMNILNYLQVDYLFQDSVISNYYSDKNKISKETAKNYLENFTLYYKTKYIEIYKNEEENKNYQEKIKSIEKNLDLNNIIMLREICIEKIENLYEISKIDKKILEKEDSWSFFNFNKEKELEDLRAEREKKIQEQKKAEEKNSMTFIVKSQIIDILNKGKSGDIKNDITQYKLSFIMNKFSFELYENKFNDSEENSLIFEIKYSQFEFLFLLKKNSEYMKFSLKDSIISQYLPESNFQNILYSDDNNSDISNEKNDTYAIFFEFEHNPSFELSAFKMKLIIDKQFKFIIDYYYIFYIMNLLLNCFKNFKLTERTFYLDQTILDTVNNAINMINKDSNKKEKEEKKDKEKETTNDDDEINFGESLVINNLINTYQSILGINKGDNENEKAFNAHIDILIKTPIFLLPLNFRNGNDKSLIYFSLGQLKLYSKLSGNENNGLVYDRYIIELTDIKATIIPDLSTIKTNKGVELLSPFSFKITLDKYIYNGLKKFVSKDNNNFPINVNLEFSTIIFSLNEDHLIFLINYLKNLKISQNAITSKFELENNLSIVENNNEPELNKNEIIPDEKSNTPIESTNESIKRDEIYNSVKLHIKFESIEFLLLKNITKNEEEYLNNFNKREGKTNTEKYKNFLSIIFKFTEFNLNLTSNGSMDIDFSFGHFFLYDNDFYFDCNLNRIPYINPELKYIVGTSSYLSNTNEKNKLKIKISDFFENQETTNNSESIKIKYKLLVEEGNVMILDIKMSKLILIPNLSTLTRLLLFSNKYLNLYTDTINKVSGEESNKITKSETLNKQKTIKSDESTKISKKNETLTDEITVKFEMDGVDIYLPVEPEKSNTTIFHIFTRIPMEFHSLTKKQITQEKDLLKIFYILMFSELKLKIGKGEVKLFDYIDDYLFINNENIIFNYENIVFETKKELISNNKLINNAITLKTNTIIDISFNSNHFISSMILLNNVNKFLIETSINQNSNSNLDDENKESNEVVQKEEITVVKQKEISNIDEFNEITNYYIDIPDLSIHLNDYIDGIYQPIMHIKLKIKNFDFYQNKNPQDSTNLKNYLKSMFQKEKLSGNNLDKKNCYMYLNLNSSLEIKYFNTILNQMEDLIEPFTIEFYYFQILKRMRAKIELNFKKMLNINISMNLAKIIRYFLEKINQLNLKKNDLQKLNDDKKKNDKNITNKTPVIIFENFTGIDINLWFDNNKDENNKKIINLKNQIKFEVFKENLKEYDLYKKNNNFSNTFSYELSIKDDKINQKNLLWRYYNINYTHTDIHKINNDYQISVENYIDNFLCRHITFNSLIIINNKTKYSNIQLSNFNKTEKFNLDSEKKKSVPLSWLFSENKKVYIVLEDDIQLLAEDISISEKINKNITFKNGDIITVNLLKYEFNLEEHNMNSTIGNAKNTGAESINKSVYKYEITLTSPIYIKNNTPYEIEIMNNNINSCGYTNIYKINPKLCLNILRLKEKNKKIIEILKNIKFKLIYNNKKFSPIDSFEEQNQNDEKEKSINKNSVSILLEDPEKSFLICRLYINNPYDSINYNKKIYRKLFYDLNSQNYEIAFDFYFVNRTNYNLNINNKKNKKIKSLCSNSEDEELNIVLAKKLFTPISKVLLHEKVKIKKKEADWSEEFESIAVGSDFIITIKNKNDTYNSFGIMVRISSIFSKSFIIIIEDKYQIINNLPFDIKLNEVSLGSFLPVKSNQHRVLLLNKDSVENKSHYQLGVDKTYTKMFDIDKVGSYDLLLRYSDKLNIPSDVNIEGKLIELNGYKYYPIRCIIDSLNKNTNFILFTYNPEFLLKFKNSTSNKLIVIINDDDHFKHLVKPNEAIPLIYYNEQNKYEPVEKITIIDDKIKKIKTTISLNDFSQSYFGNYVSMVQPKNNNSYKVIEVIEKAKNINENKTKSKKFKLKTLNGFDFKLYSNGIGLSIIDETPKEIFYFSIYEIETNYKYYNKNDLSLSETSNIITLSVKNMQLDYCLDDSFKYVFCPTNQILPDMLNNKENKIEEIIPFIQMNLFQKIITDSNTNKEMYRFYPEITVIIQEFEVCMTTVVINKFIDLGLKYQNILLTNNNNTNDDNTSISKDPNLQSDNYSDQNINIIKDILLNKITKDVTLIITSLLLSAIKMNITFRLERDALNIQFLPNIFNTILYTVCSTMSSVSDCTLSLNELKMLNINNDIVSFQNTLISFYKFQFLKQLYKIICGLDLIGNPIKLIEGISTGVFEFFNEPRKALLQGPSQFGYGLYKGTTSLISGVVGGSFSSMSKMTGSLLNASKNFSNLGTIDEKSEKYEEGPSGLIDGTVTGVKKGFGELTSGITGIVTKPLGGAKKEGFFGFVKGVGSGILGAALSPVNTVLAFGKNVSEGISNSEVISNKKVLRRFRKPRILYKFLPIMPYGYKVENGDGEKYKYENVEVELNNEKLFLENSTKIIVYEQLRDKSHLIFTDVLIKVFSEDFKTLKVKIYVKNITNIQTSNKNINDLVIAKKDGTMNLISFSTKKSQLVLKNEITNLLNL